MSPVCACRSRASMSAPPAMSSLNASTSPSRMAFSQSLFIVFAGHLITRSTMLASVSLLSFVEWLNETPLSVYLRESNYPFPILETTHILGLILSVGFILWVDLRLLGLAMRQEPTSKVVRQFEPW